MKKIRFVNPIKECLRIQGKGYTVSLITTIVGLLVLSIVSGILLIPICAIISGIVGIGSIIGFGWWFGTEEVLDEEFED